MRSLSKFAIAGACALLLTVPAIAQIPEASVFPVDEPTWVGDTLLQPGTYTIRLVPSDQNRNIVQVVSQDGQTVHATTLSVPHQLDPTEEMPNTMFVFYPAGNGGQRALRTWYAADPVSNGGHDIVYEESRARELARAADTRVVWYADDVAEADLGTTELQVIGPDATVEPYTYTVPETRVAQSTTTTRVAETRPEELPATSSRMPLVGLLGVLAVAAAAVIRFVR